MSKKLKPGTYRVEYQKANFHKATVQVHKDDIKFSESEFEAVERAFWEDVVWDDADEWELVSFERLSDD